MNWNLLKQDTLAMSIMAIIASSTGLLINQFRDKPLSLVYQSKEERLISTVNRLASKTTSNSVSVSVEKSIHRILILSQFRAFVANKGGLVLDARPEIFYRLGHVPGALSLSQEDFVSAYSLLKERLESNKNQPLALYCSSSSCEDSKTVQRALTSLGYTNIAIFKGGWTEWTEADLPVEKNQ